MPVTVDIPRSWWSRFTAEGICDDATYESDDETLYLTAMLLDDRFTRVVKVTKSVRRVSMLEPVLECLLQHAEWYSYYWGEAMAQEAYDSGERLGYISAGRSSAAFAERLRALID